MDVIVDHFQGGARLITLTGPGGVGKTRLALEAVRRAAESLGSDALFIDLAPVDDCELVPSVIARSLGVRDAGDRTLRESLRVATRERRLLLVLDNFEQVVEAAPLVTDLLADLSGLEGAGHEPRAAAGLWRARARGATARRSWNRTCRSRS